MIGVDVGGTKTHLAVVAPDGTRHDTIVASASWRHGAMFADPQNLARLAALLTAAGPRTTTVIGLHDLDTPAQQRIADAALGALVPGRLRVVNDAELLGPAAGLTTCLRLIVGTGAIALGTTADGGTLVADGHGALLADHGSAPALVREAVRAGLRLADAAGPDAALADPVVALLCAAYAVPAPADLAVEVSHDDPYAWGRHAPLIFQALESGSRIARTVVEEAAGVLAGNVAALRRRGALGDVVVGAGGVLTAQRVLQDLLAERLEPGVTLRVLTEAPVEGALALAAR
ncbi:sugar kinase [Actinoplanes sp. NBRC 101535]|nr:sugar kinase [Actinoplanes sp. NBRC 101535]